jgi:hypothetical protein
MRELDKISAALFDKIRARFDHVNIGNENAQRVTDPESARFLTSTMSATAEKTLVM